MQLTDTLSHNICDNIISHKTDTDEPITKAVSKYRIQTLSSLTEQVVIRPYPSGHNKSFLGPDTPSAIYCTTLRVDS